MDHVRLLCWGNVEKVYFGNVAGVLLTLYKTKTIQNAERIQQVPLARNDDCPILCPDRAIDSQRLLIGEANIGPDVPLIQTRDFQGNLRPVLYHKFTKWFKHSLSEMKLDSALYTLHAFRHGGIQQTLMSEQNLALVKLTSDHTSDVILEYSHVPADRRLTISQKVNRNLTTFVTGNPPPGDFLPANVLAHC